MELKYAEPRCILIISPEAWDAHTVSKHHYAKALADGGANVYFLSPPDGNKATILLSKVEGHPRLHIVSSPRVAPGLQYYPSFLRRWFERLWLERLEKKVGRRMTTIWLFENSRFFDMRFAGERLKIYHQVDLNQDFHVARAVLTADICFCTTQFIKERLLPYTPNVHKIHHGLAAASKSIALTEEQSCWLSQKSPQAVYIGNLDMLYLDAKLLADVAIKFGDVQFHFVGGYTEEGALRTLTAHLPNVTWWGRVSSSLILAILEKADILLVTYKAAQYREQLASPHKFLEYFDSGKAIVATYTDEYKDKRHLLEMVDDSADYIETFDKVVNDLSTYNSEEKQVQRKEFARANSYDKQLEKIFALLKQHGLIED